MAKNIEVDGQQYFAFDPRTIPGCALWLDAADPSTITFSRGSNVSTWRDKVNNNSYTPFGGTPTFAQNTNDTLGSIYFNGSSSLNGSVSITNPYSIFVIAKQTTTPAGNVRIINGGGGSVDCVLYMGTLSASNNNYASFIGNGGTAWNDVVTNSPTTNILNNWALLGNDVSGATITPNINGTVMTARTGSNNGFGMSAINIGGSYSNINSQCFTGFVGEVIMYNGTLSSSQRQQIEGYLIWKWGVMTTSPAATSSVQSGPLDIPGCALWLDAADYSSFSFSAGSRISQWNDKSGNSRHAIPNTGSGIYSSTALGSTYPGVVISSSGNMRSPVNAGTFSSAVSAFVVWQKTGLNNTFDTLIARSGVTYTNWCAPFDMYISDSGMTRLVGEGTGGNFFNVPGDTALRNKNPNIFYFSILASSPNVWNESINGVVSSYRATTSTVYSDLGTSVFLGTRGDNTTRMNGVISEVIMYNTVITAAQRQQIELYLSTKWGITTSLTVPRFIRANVSNPLEIASCALWLDASDPSTIAFSSGSNISSWRDKANGNSYTVSAGTPTLLQNASGTLSAVSFNGVSSLNGSCSITNPYSIFVVARQTATPGSYTRIINGGGSSTDGVLFVGTFSGTTNYASFIGNVSNWNDTNVNSPNTSLLNTWSVLSNEINDKTITPYINGSVMTAKTGANTAAAMSAMSIGASFSNSTSQCFTGYVGEVIVYNGRMTTEDRQRIENYLMWKWGASAQPQPQSQLTTPLGISGCSLWLDASDSSTITLSGSSVTAWNDKSGNSRHATVSAANGPTYVTSAQSGLRPLNTITFNGTNQFLNSSTTVAGNAHTLIAVHKPASIAGNTSLFRFQQTNGQYVDFPYYWPNSTGSYPYGYVSWFDSVQDWALTPPLLENSSINGFNIICASIASGSQIIRNNGYTTATGTITMNSGTSDSLTIGRYTAGNSEFYSGTVCEIIVFNKALTLSELQQIETYLAVKWIGQGLGTPNTLNNFITTPLTIPGCSLWLDSSDDSTFTPTNPSAGTSITAWRDKVANVNFASGGTAPTRSSTTINGLSPVKFSANGYLFNSTFTHSGSARSGFVVFREDSEGSNAGILSFASGSVTDYNAANAFSYDTGSSGQTYQIASGFGAGGYGTAVTGTGPTPLAVYSDTFSSKNQIVYVNGVQSVTATSTLTHTTSTGLYIGVRYFGGTLTAYLNGIICEVIMFNRGLTIAERQQVETYLALKWGFQGMTGPLGVPTYLPTSITTPTVIPNCSLWLDATDSSTLTLSGSNVTAWRDKTQNGISVTTDTGTVTRSTINGNTSLSFNGSARMSFASFTQTASKQYFHWFIVANTTTTSPAYAMITGTSYTNGNNQVGIYINAGTLTAGNRNTSGGTFYPRGYTLNTPTFIGYSTSDFTTGRYGVGINGNMSYTTGGSTGTMDTGTVNFYIGKDNYATNPYFTGNIGEIILYTGDLSTQQRQLIEDYLAKKWNIDTPTLPVDITSPVSIPGCVLWLDASDSSSITTSTGNAMTAWSDKSGNSNNVSYFSSTPPTYNSSSKAVTFTAANANVIRGSLGTTYSNEASVFIVGTYVFNSATTYAPRLCILGIESTSDNTFAGQLNLIAQQTGMSIATYYSDGTNPTGLGTNVQTYIPAVYNVPFIYANQTTYNGTTMTTSTFLSGNSPKYSYISKSIASSSTTVSTYNKYVFGGYITTSVSPNGDSYNGTINEIIIINRNVSTYERKQIERYLSNKWNVPINKASIGVISSPLTIPNCGLWLDGADPLNGVKPNAGDSISTWVDKSPDANNATAAGTTPIMASNTGGVLFSAGHYNTNYSASLSNETLFVVYNYTATTGILGLVGQSANGGRFLDINTSTRQVESSTYNVAFGGVSTNNTTTVNVTGIACLVTTGGSMQIFHNGVQTGTAVSPAITGSLTSKIGVGFNAGSANTTQYMKGVIFEVIGYARSLTTTERNQVEDYLMRKWNLFRSVGLWQPTTIPSCALWLDGADDSTFTFSSGSNISVWRDKSPTGTTALPLRGATANQIIRTGDKGVYINNNGSATYNSSTYATLAIQTNFMQTADWSIFAIVNNPSNTTSIIFTDNRNASGSVLSGTGLNHGFIFEMATDGTTNRMSSPTTAFGTGTRIVSGHSTKTRHDVYNNGVLWGFNATTLANYDTDAGPLPVIGSGYNTLTNSADNSFFTGTIYEFIVFGAYLTDSQRQQVEGYLAWKWGLQSSLPSSHPYAQRFALTTTHPFRLYPPVMRQFNPVDLGSLALWWDASNYSSFGFSSGTTISSWTDQINGIPLTVANSAPSLVGGNSVFFNNPSSVVSSSSQNLWYTNASLSNVKMTQNGTLIIAHQPTYNDSYRAVFTMESDSATYPRYFVIAQCGANEGHTAGVLINSSTWGNLRQAVGVTTLAKRIDTIVSSPTSRMFTNGVETTSYVNNIGPGVTYSNSIGIRNLLIGGSATVSGNRVYGGYVYEILYFTSTLTLDQVRMVEIYLAKKWDMPYGLLPTSNTFRLYKSLPSTPIFLPNMISGCSLWLDFADTRTITPTGITNGTLITAITEKSGNNRSITVDSAPTYIANATNSLGCLSFNGTSRLTTTLATAIGTGNCYSVMVLRPTGIPRAQYVFANSGNTAASFGMIYLDATGFLRTSDFGQTSVDIESAPAYSSFAIVSSRRSGGIQKTRCIQNQTLTNSLSSGALSYDTSVRIGYAAWGGSPLSASQFIGEIGEIIVYNGTITDQQQDTIEAYLAWKWGLQSGLPSLSSSSLRNPVQNPSPSLWLDANDYSTFSFSSGTTISAWRDKSGNYRDATPTGTFTYSSTAAGGKPAVVFPSLAETYLRGSIANNNGSALTCFAVFRYNDTSVSSPRVISLTNGVVGDYNSLVSVAAIIPYPSANSYASYRNSAQLGTANGTGYYNSLVLVSSVFTGSNHTVFVNGTAGTTVASTGNFGYNTYSLGTSTAETGRRFDGYMCEIIVFDYALNAPFRQQVEEYLGNKWGISTYIKNGITAPTDISNCRLWLDASSGVTSSSGTLTGWTDRSANNSSVTITSAPTYSATGFNNLPGLTFASGNRLSVAISALGTTFTLVAVYRITGSSTVNSVPLSIGASSVGTETGIGYNGTGFYNFYDYGVNDSRNTTYTVNTNVIHIGVKTGTQLLSYMNGTSPLQAVLSTFNNTNTTINIGGTGFPFIGNLAEVIVYTRALNDYERQKLESYLATKWNMTSVMQSPSVLTSPLQVPGCTLWLDGSDSSTVTIATGVSAWRDKSGNANNFIQSNTSRQPVFTQGAINGLSALSFTGLSTGTSTNQVLDNPTISINGSAYTVFAVARGNVSQPSSNYNYILKGNNTTDGYLFVGCNPSKFFATFSGSGTWNDINANSPNITVTNTTLLMGMVVSGSVLTPYYNGIAMTAKTGTTTSFTSMRIGDAPDAYGGQNWNGVIAEIIIYNYALTNVQRRQVETYLRNKWAIANPPHPYKNFRP